MMHLLYMEISRLRDLLSDLVNDNRLCCPAGHQLVAEFNCRGDMDAVINHVQAYIDDLSEITMLTDELRQSIVDRVERGEAERHRLFTDDFAFLKNTIEMASITEDIEMLPMHFVHKQERADTLHNKHECLCYTNKE